MLVCHRSVSCGMVLYYAFGLSKQDQKAISQVLKEWKEALVDMVRIADSVKYQRVTRQDAGTRQAILKDRQSSPRSAPRRISRKVCTREAGERRVPGQ